MGRVSPGLPSLHSDGSSEDEDTDGGVPLNPPSYDVKGKRPSRDVEDATIHHGNWPDLVPPATPLKGKSGSTSTESPGGAPLDTDYTSYFLSSHGATQLLGEAKLGSTSVGPHAGPSRYSDACASPQRATAHGKIQGIDPEGFWNAEKGRYYCNCGASFLYVGTFEYHLTMEDETINE